MCWLGRRKSMADDENKKGRVRTQPLSILATWRKHENGVNTTIKD
jgi:hypothetical protein